MPIQNLNLLVRSLRLEEISEHPTHLQRAFDVIASSYAQFSSQKMEKEMLIKELCNDVFNASDKSRTFAVFGDLPSGESNILLATTRAILNHPHQPVYQHPFEMMQLIEPEMGWQRFSTTHLNLAEAVEYSRFATNELLSIPNPAIPAYKKIIFRLLMEGSFARIGQTFDKRQAWALMPRRVSDFVQCTGIKVWIEPNISLKVEDNQDLFETYSRYWSRGDLGIVQFLMDPEGPTYFSAALTQSLSSLSANILRGHHP